AHVGFVDLVERRVFRGAEVAGVGAPLTLRRAALGGRGNRREQHERHGQETPRIPNALAHRPVLRAHCIATYSKGSTRTSLAFRVLAMQSVGRREDGSYTIFFVSKSVGIGYSMT